MQSTLVWGPELASHELEKGHPLDPKRLTLTVELINSYGFLPAEQIVAPCIANEDELRLVHSLTYIEAVQESSDWSAGLHAGAGLGTEDNPIYPGMHQAAALVCGSSITAVENVMSGASKRSFSLAGGMHHAHKGRAAGFSVYNDCAVAIAVARQRRPGLRALYIDIDGHHGDGVQEAFYSNPEVMTLSIHESGLYVFPGTGFPSELGMDAGEGYSVNAALPQNANDECYRRVFSEIVSPVARAFAPDVIVAQLGVDAHYDDPLTNLGVTLPGYRELVRGIIGLADELCEGRLAALGGGGYRAVETVPRAWAWVMAELAGAEIDEQLPEEWRRYVKETTGMDAPLTAGGDDTREWPEDVAAAAMAGTAEVIEDVRRHIFPFHGL